MKAQIFSGVIPALMTPCKADRTPDFDGLVRKGKELIAKPACLPWSIAARWVTGRCSPTNSAWKASSAW
jgi:hypothetical protein